MVTMVTIDLIESRVSIVSIVTAVTIVTHPILHRGITSNLCLISSQVYPALPTCTCPATPSDISWWRVVGVIV